MININPDKHNPLLANCRVMREYSQFVEATRKHKGDKRALERSVRECISKGILAEYLRRKGSEVVNMLMAEYDYDMDIAVQRKEAAEEAEKRGEARGIAEINQLNAALCADDRLEDLKRSMEDPVYQEQLLKEYRIGKYAQEQ